jgi:hypothetical protein
MRLFFSSCPGKLRWVKEFGALVSLSAALAIASTAQTLTTLHSFDETDGAVPGILVQATDGNLYATTEGGGAYPKACFFFYGCVRSSGSRRPAT